MRIYPYSSDLPSRICAAFPTAEKLLCPTPPSKPAAAAHQGVSYPTLTCLCSHRLSSPSQGTGETGMRAASSGCPTSWHPGRAAPGQPPAWLTPSCPCGGSEYMLHSSHWLPERKGFGEEEEKGGNGARKTTPGFLHPQEAS